MLPSPTAANISFEARAFGNGQPSVTVGFPGAGMDDSASLSLQTGLSIDSASLHVSSAPPPSGSDYPTNVTVDIGGDGVAEWQFQGKNTGSLGRQTVFKTGRSLEQMEFRNMNYNDTLAVRLPKNATVSSAKMNVSMAAKGRVLVIYGSKNQAMIDDTVNKLKAFKDDFATVDTFDGGMGTPKLDQLLGYSACFVWIAAYSGFSGYTQWSDRNALGDVLADYVDAGGGVVTANYCWYYTYGTIGGRFLTGGYWGINTGVSGMSGTSFTMGTISKPDHPIMKDVKSIRFTNTAWCPSPYVTSGINGGEIVFSWSFGSCGAAVVKTQPNGANRVDLIMNPWSDALAYPGTGGQGYTGDGDILIRNSLLWTGKSVSGADVAAPGAAIDVLKDGVNEFNEDTYAGNYSLNIKAAKINDYLAAAPVAYTDPYGNEFVDVPINVTPKNRTVVFFGDLDIIYSYSADIDKNPVTGDLASSLSELTSPKPGNYNTTIPILISSTSAGRLKLHDLKLTMRAPYHRPSITSVFPAATTVVKEGTTLELGINATDWYGAPLTYKWFYDGEPVDGVTDDRMTMEYGFKDAGSYTARVEVSNSFETVQRIWKITVQNVNRPPEITAVSPDGDQTISEGSPLVFSVQATDPDEDPIGYIWILDNVVQGSSSSAAFTYRTDSTSAGDHKVRLTAVDPGSLSTVEEWTVHVKNVDRPPLLTAWEPKDDPTLIENQEQLFTVGATDEDGQELAVSWSLDGTSVSAGNSYLYKTDHNSAGIKTLKVTATDGELWASHEWEITVLDLNRPPTAAIGSPKNNAEFGEGTAIHFSAGSSSDPDGEKLSYSWKEGAIMVSDQAEFDMAFAHGLHTLVLEVRDHAGAVSQATVHFRVRWVELSLVMGLDRLDASAGDNVMIIVTMGNVGDTRAADQKLDILVDGKRIATEDLPTLDSSGSYRTQFQWKATKGAHTITAVVGDQSWNQPVSVAGGKTAAAGAAFNDLMWMVLIVVLAVALAIWGMYAMGKKE